MRRAGLIALAILALAALSSAGGAYAEPPEDRPPSVGQAALRVTETGKALEAHSDGFWLDETPDAPALLTTYWNAIHDWAAAWLWSRTDEKPTALAVAGKAFDDFGEWSVLQLDQSDVLVAASRGEQGEVFILHHAQGRWTEVWSLTSWAAGRTPHDPLAAWSPARSRFNCRSGDDEQAWRSCGALRGRIGRLPPDRHGRPRFFIDADYAQEAGANIGGQASIWVWTGERAEPQYVHVYGLTIEQDAGVRLKGDRLLIREKDSFKTLFACAACLGRQMERTVLLTPDGAHDLGRVSLRPDLDLVDQAMDRVLSGQAARLSVSPQAAAVLKSDLAELRARRLSEPKTTVDLGMLDGWTLKPSGATRRLCLATDQGGTFIFTLTGRGRLTRIVGVALRNGDCGKKVRN